jgi:hypothetical protein
MSRPSVLSRPRRLAALAAAALVAVGVSTLYAAPAAAAGVGYVRLAHLSPDTPDVDVYLSAVPPSGPAKKFPGVGYGVVSPYLPLPAGTYAVAMRNAGAGEGTPPVLTTQVTVEAGKAYTVAGVGRHADLGLRVINDDLSVPSGGKAKVRIVQASLTAPVLDVSVASGPAIANGVQFASTTGYREVDQGNWTVKLQQAGGGGPASSVQCALSGGNVYSLIVLDRPSGLTAELHTDAQRGGPVPAGGVDTGAGGSRHTDPAPALALASLVLLGGGFALSSRGRRLRGHRP